MPNKCLEIMVTNNYSQETVNLLSGNDIYGRYYSVIPSCKGVIFSLRLLKGEGE